MHIGWFPVYYTYWPNPILNTMKNIHFFQFVKLNELSGQILPHLVLSSIEQGEWQMAHLLPTSYHHIMQISRIIINANAGEICVQNMSKFSGKKISFSVLWSSHNSILIIMLPFIFIIIRKPSWSELNALIIAKLS